MIPDLHSFADIHTHSGPSADAVLSVEPDAALVGKYGEAWYSVGIHPWSTVDEVSEATWVRLEQLVEDPRVVAVGEAGLDKKRGGDTARQEEVFRRQAALAEKTGKPLIIHCVGRYGRIIELHKELRPQSLWIIHGFTGKPELARQLVAEGFGISLGLRSDHALADIIPPERLFRETD
ncbi:MAG: hydrolase TatD [Bacteroidales bacterium]|nr:hydrolase TatD [Bacteroidales bacterium]